MNSKHLILFLSDGGNNLHLMAEGFARRIMPETMDVIGASMTPPGLNPVSVALMNEKGVDITGLDRLCLLDVEPFMFDLIITLGDFDQSCRPTLPGMPPHFHWDLPDPGPSGDAAALVEQLRQARDMLETRIRDLFASDLLGALFVSRRNLELVLDNLQDGVMAHTRTRRIFFFNKAAEQITGRRREQLLGKDCHDVFPGRFCGGFCEFCEGEKKSQSDKGIVHRDVTYRHPDGREAILKMAVMPLYDDTQTEVGAIVSFKDETELHFLKKRLKRHHSLGGLIGRDPKMLDLFDHIREVAAVSLPVYIEGESGTGKELVANAIHDNGPRAGKPFVAVNCGALPEGVLESELFGHVRGAFSGAVNDRKGRFELAHEGTIFLDEVTELPAPMQVKLLRVLQEQIVEPVGSEQARKVDVRVISASNQDIRRLMEQKKFRRDLFYRLCVVPITLPPLRERQVDIPVLVDFFLEKTARELNRPVLVPSDQVLDLFDRYPWPGNVRELRNTIEFAYVKCRRGLIETGHLPPEILSAAQSHRMLRPGPRMKSREDVLRALEQAEGNRKEAARFLGVSRATLYRYLVLYDLK
ncbi:MAG: sigma 54-interacting transcriptional regulator [Thermodesulfobacteriota bacterium]